MIRLALLMCIGCLLVVTSCGAGPEPVQETCDFNFNVLGYDKARIQVRDGPEVVFEDVSYTPEKATEISLSSGFSLKVPTKISFFVEGRRRHTLKVQDCEKLGVVLDKRGREAVLLHMDDFLFQ